MDEKETFKWRKQDYFWLIALILILWYITATVRLNDNFDVVNIISLISSGVSVALAIIAIWWGNVNNVETSKVYRKIGHKLDGVKNEAETINQKLDEVANCLKKNVDSFLDISEGDKNKLKDTVDDTVSKIKSGWKKDEKGWYFNGDDGKPVKNEWKKDGRHWFYLNADGYITIGELIASDDKLYYVDESGKLFSDGLCATKKGLMYFETNGQAFRDGEKNINGKVYIFKGGICEE